MSLLRVRNLHVTFPGPSGPVPAVTGLSLDVSAGETVAMVGESGCGKSTVALAILGMLPHGAVVSGSVQYDGVELRGLPARRWRRLRGSQIAAVFQDPMTALHPSYPVGRQLVRAVVGRQRVSRGRALELACAALERVGLRPAGELAQRLPHQLSGGQRQRVAVALAMVNRPRLILADEATTALDMRAQDEVVDALQLATRSTGASLLLISHDLALVAGVADRVAVVYAGAPVEVAPVDRLFAEPRTPYTSALLRAHPSTAGGARLSGIPGWPPQPTQERAGCAFGPRCSLRIDLCEDRPALAPTDSDTHTAACHRWRDLAGGHDLHTGAGNEEQEGVGHGVR